MLGKEKALQLVQDFFQKITEHFDITQTILNNEQNNFVRQNYEDRSVMILSTDDNQVNEPLHNEAPNTFN